MYIRKMEVADIEGVKRLNEKNLPENYPLEFYRYYTMFNPSFCYVAEENEDILGYILSRPDPSGEGFFVHIISLCVDEDHRSRGIGKGLVQSIIDQIHGNIPELGREFDLYRISLYVRVSNTSAIKFYEKNFGFEKLYILEDYYSDGENAYEMVLCRPMS